MPLAPIEDEVGEGRFGEPLAVNGVRFGVGYFELDPDDLAHLAAGRGVRVMALTDHDTFRGVDRARSVAHRRGLGYVRALEVTTYPPNQMRHILGHGVDLNHPRLLALLDRTQGVFRRQPA